MNLPTIPALDIISQIGIGGMSTVWKAYDYILKREVAVKLLNRNLVGSREDVSHFTDEEKVMEAIDHEGIVKSHRLGTHDGTWYFVMEYVDGYNFATLLNRKLHLIETDCLLICESVASALDYAWNNHGIVHCDIKPENIMINSDGIVKLTDLGICHTFAYMKDGKKAIPDHILGTPAYISPEQVFGDVEPDCRTDIYSLAASLYHLATGRILFPGLDNEEMLKAHCSSNMQAKDPRVYRPELSEGFCQMLEAMLVKDRNERIDNWKTVISMCLEIENGHAFKPRESIKTHLSSIKLDSALQPRDVPRA